MHRLETRAIDKNETNHKDDIETMKQRAQIDAISDTDHESAIIRDSQKYRGNTTWDSALYQRCSANASPPSDIDGYRTMWTESPVIWIYSAVIGTRPNAIQSRVRITQTT